MPSNYNYAILVSPESPLAQMARKAVFSSGLSAAYILSCGIPFCSYASLSFQLETVGSATRSRGTDVDVEMAARSLERQIPGWKTIRVASGVMGVGVGIPAFVLYFQSWLLTEKLAEIFLMLSVVLSSTSFSSSTILISSFSDWSGDINELKSHLFAWSILFSIPNITLAWSAMSLFTAVATFSANEIVFDSPLDYFETAVTILMFFIGLAVTTLFYMVHTIWKL